MRIYFVFLLVVFVACKKEKKIEHNVPVMSLEQWDSLARARVSETVSRNPEIEKFHFWDSPSDSIPHDLFKMKSLIDLSIENTNLVSIPSRICELVELQNLSVSRNLRLTDVSSIGCLKKLEYLDLHLNNLTELPEALSNLESLKVLDVTNNSFRNPSNLSLPPNLELLNFTNCDLTEFPAGILKLVRLSELYISDNAIDSIPGAISDLESLEVLRISGNPLSSEDEKRLKKLLPNCNIVF